MEIQFTGQNLKVTPALREHTEKKMHSILKNHKIVSAQTTFKLNNDAHIAEMQVNIPGKTLHAQAEGSDMYKAIDTMVSRLSSQLETYRGKQTDHR